MPRKSNSFTAREAAARVRALINECEAGGGTLPVKKGALWHAEIKRQATLTNGQIDSNESIREMLVEHAAKHGIAFSRRGHVAPEEDAETSAELGDRVLTSRLREAQLGRTRAERLNAELKAEIASLRSKLRRNDEVAELIALGGRMAPGSS